MTWLLDWSRDRTLATAALLSLLVNVAVFAAAVGFGDLLTRLFRLYPVGERPEPVTRAELALATSCVLLNSLVMFVGWWLWKAGWLTVVGEASVGRVLVDATSLVVAMDVAMYATHRLAHVPWAYRWVHGVHHRYERVRALNLFTLHPLEVLGFGSLWLAVLSLHGFSLGGMLLYLTLNTAFGVVGHVGVEPFPSRVRALWPLSLVGSSTFHAHHHQSPASNYGFYTSLWDRLFRTLDARERRERAP